MIMILSVHYISQTTGYINKFEENKIAMALMVEDKQLLQIYKKILKKIKRLMGINFESRATDNDKYVNTKIKTYKDSITTNFYNKTGFKEVPQEKVFINNNSRFCSLCIWKVLPTNIFRRMWRCEKNVTTKNYIDMELESGFDSDSDSDYGIYIDIDDEE